MIINNIIHSVLQCVKMHEALIRKFDNELVDLPQGQLVCREIRNRVRCYHSQKRPGENATPVQKYISKENEELIFALIRREFIEKSLKIMQNNVKAAYEFLKKFKPYDPDKIEATLAKKYKGLTYKPKANGALSPEDLPWEKEPYDKNEYHPEGLKHNTLNGLKVRSKSEAIIAGLLEAEDIPFRYEAQLVLGSQKYYPDFTILRPRDRQILYWEHFGMADDREYSMSMHQKIDTYIRHGIIPGTHLIMSFETKENTIDPRAIASMIKAYISE